jgi:hypothetical protein
MDFTMMAKQMAGVYKSTLDRSNNAIAMIQENSEKMLNLSLEKAPWFPEEGKKFVTAWMKAYKKGYDDLKVAADEQYKKMEAFINPSTKS